MNSLQLLLVHDSCRQKVSVMLKLCLQVKAPEANWALLVSETTAVSASNPAVPESKDRSLLQSVAELLCRTQLLFFGNRLFQLGHHMLVLHCICSSR